jgi:hypothetical protein
VVPTTVLGRGGEGRADDTVPGCGDEGWADGAVPRRFDVEEERGAVVEAHAEEVARWRTHGGGGHGGRRGGCVVGK